MIEVIKKGIYREAKYIIEREILAPDDPSGVRKCYHIYIKYKKNEPDLRPDGGFNWDCASMFCNDTITMQEIKKDVFHDIDIYRDIEKKTKKGEK